MRPLLAGSVSGAAVVLVAIAILGKRLDEWERRQLDAYKARFPTVTIPAPVYTSSLPQRTFGGVTRHVVVDWSDAPAT